MKVLRDASPYGRGRRFMIGTILAMPVIAWGIPLALTAFSFSGETVMLTMIPLVFGWVLIGGIWSLLIGCPKCGTSVFMRRFLMSVPWPARKCSNCSADLTAS